jgi:hypothetical protein
VSRRVGTDAVAAVREPHPRLAAISGDSPALARFSLADAQLVIARQHGYPSWASLRRIIEVVIRPVASPRELVLFGITASSRTCRGHSGSQYRVA